MFKYFFILILLFLTATTAFCQKSDTAILYYSYQLGKVQRVASLAEADYFRLILPPDPGDNERRNVKEYYKDGHIKMITKLTSDFLVSDYEHFNGDYVTYYPNGKRLSTAQYSEGNLTGLEYRFYPNGRIYCTIKHEAMGRRALYWECFDTLGNQICTAGTGRFIDHIENKGYPDIIFEGPVVKGYANGEWNGKTTTMFSFKFNVHYKNGRLISADGYDKLGNKYPFKQDMEGAAYKKTVMEFVEDLNENIKLPRDANGNRISLDAYHLRFIVEKDGQISHPDIVETRDTLLTDAIAAGIRKCYAWTPTRVFGIPVRTEVIVQLKTVNRHQPVYKVGLLRLYQMYLTWRVLPEDEMLGK
jgi:hypothetical protein